MPNLRLESLFDKARDELAERMPILKVAQGLTQRVGSDGFEVAPLSGRDLVAQDRKIRVFDQTLRMRAGLTPRLLIHPASTRLPVFQLEKSDQEPDFLDDPAMLPGSASQPYAELSLAATASVSGKLNPPNSSVLGVSASGAVGGQLIVRHVMPVSAGDIRAVALQTLLARSALPQYALAKPIEKNEVYVLETLLHVDFGLKLTLGREWDLGFVVELTEGLPAEVKAHVKLTFEASLGGSLYERMQLAVGRFDLVETDWTRIRLQRLHRRRLTFGAKTSLQVEYDLATKALKTILERAFDFLPTPRLLDTFREIDDLFQKEGWEGVKGKLSGDLAKALSGYLKTEEWKSWIETSEEVADLVAASRRVVAAWDQLDEKIQDLWSELLGAVDLRQGQKIRRALTKIAALDAAKPNDLLAEIAEDEEWKQALDLLESFGGLSLENLLVGSDREATAVLAEAKRLATEALGFLDRADDTVLAKIRDFGERTGIDSALTFLRDHVSSPADVADLVDERIQGLLAKLAGKALDLVDQEDLDGILEFVGRALDAFDHIEDWERRLRGYVERLKGELGFSLSLEMSRVTERAALLDLEVDATRPSAFLAAVRDGLEAGNARDILEALPQAEDTGNGSRPFLIRESLFFRRQVRSSSLTFVLSLLGMRSTSTRRIREQLVEITQDAGGIRRRGTYTSGMTRTLTADNGARSANSRELSVWLDADASGTGTRLRRAYDELVTSLRLSFTHEDDKTQPHELKSMHELVTQLGFTDVLLPHLPDDADSLQTRFALEVRLPEAAVEALFAEEAEPDSDDAAWHLDYLNAAQRSFDEKFLPKKIDGIRRGWAFSRVIQTGEFRRHWWRGQVHFRNALRGKTWTLPLGDERTTVTLVTGSGGIQNDFIEDMVNRQGSRFQRLQDIGARLRSAAESRTPSDLELLSKRMAGRFPKTLVRGWRNPLSPLWLCIARVNRLAPESLKGAKGFVSLRWRLDAEQPWSEPQIWPLENGVPERPEPDVVFPL